MTQVTQDNERARPAVICREIQGGDLEAVAAVLSRGFPGRPHDYWLRGLNREKVRAIPYGFPRYGYMLESNGRAVGAILVLYSLTTQGGQPAVICNVGSWYVDSAFRGQGPRLLRAALSRKDVTYTGTTPVSTTWSYVERLGFKPYCRGLFFSLPFLSGVEPSASVAYVAPDSPLIPGLSHDEWDILVEHAKYGCVSLVCRTPSQGAEPFVFVPFRIRQGRIPLPAMQLVYSRSIESYRHCAGAIGRKLLMRGRPVVILSANAAVPGLWGVYTAKRGRKYSRGPHIPALNDLTNTEFVLFGF